MDGPGLLLEFRQRQDEMVAALAQLVNLESPSSSPPALAGLARSLLERFEAAGARVEQVAGQPGGPHLRAEFGASAGAVRPGLILGHFDTVWPEGTIARQPFRIEDGRAYGPGSYDMKAGIVLAEFALRAIQALGLALRRPVVVLLTSDEEIGSPSSRSLIEEHARESAYALVLEPPLRGGALKTARKGVGRFTVAVEGRPAHAGVEPEKGVSAILELAHQVVSLHALNDVAAGLTVNVGLIRGGTALNVVPPHASAEVDVRVTTMEQARRIESALRALRPVNPSATVIIGGGFNRPPMERTPSVAALFAHARAIGRSLGLDLAEGSTGGGSDGNFTAALGVPTLDGLGVPGDGAHAVHEHIEIAAFAERAALLAGLILTL